MQANLKVGDEVGMARWSRYCLMDTGFGRVVKINGHGHIFVETTTGEVKRFDKYGNAYKNQWGPSLMNADSLREELAAERRRRARKNTVREIEGVLKSGWSYSGDWHASSERIEALKNLVELLEDSVDCTA